MSTPQDIIGEEVVSLIESCRDEIGRLHDQLRGYTAIQERVSLLEAAIETSGLTFRNTDSGPNLVGDWPRVAAPRWISVAERLPENSDDVLLAMPRTDGDFLITTGYYLAAAASPRWFARSAEHGWLPAYWMPLPPPPSSESQRQ